MIKISARTDQQIFRILFRKSRIRDEPANTHRINFMSFIAGLPRKFRFYFAIFIIDLYHTYFINFEYF